MALDEAVAPAGVAARRGSNDPLAERLFETRRISTALAEPLSEEDQVVQSMEDASPTKWHLAHTTWFFEAIVLRAFDKAYRPFDANFAYCFNSYYENEGPRHPRPRRGLLTRPPNAKVRAYRAHVDAALEALFEREGDDLPQEALDLIELGINHEQQHQELILTDILHAFSEQPLRPAYTQAEEGRGASAPLDWLSFEGGLVTVGHDGNGFAYDNEGPRHQVFLYPFKLASRCVTNAEWMEFMADGGYDISTLWLSDGWATVCSEGWRAPGYWEETDDGWAQMSLLGLKPLDPAAPVTHVSYYEADAFARWAGKRLPSEFEWEVAAEGLPVAGRTLGAGAFRPRPAAANGKPGLLQMYGDVWEWTQSAYAPYPGFKPATGAVGEYNGKFMCSQYVLRGGSCATPDGHVRRTYRNFFYPHQRWQFMGLRLADDA